MPPNEKYEIQVASHRDIYRHHHQIGICQDGKFAATFDTENLRIRILENTDHRSFSKEKTKATSQQFAINKTIVDFKINDDLGYEANYDVNPFNAQESEFGIITADKIDNASDLNTSVIATETGQWSLDVSNLQKLKKNGNVGNEYYIFVALSHIDVDKYMKGKKNNDNNDTRDDHKERQVKKKEFRIKESDIIIEMESQEETKKGTVIYCLKLIKKHENYVLNDVNHYYSSKVSGICRFVEDSRNEDFILKRFILLNFYGIYSYRCKEDFKLIEKFDYPKCIRRELDYWYTEKNCMNRLSSCIYDKYFLVRQYKNNVLLLEVYDLEDMKLETTVKRPENTDEYLGKHVYSISKLQLCFTQGINSIGLYMLESGLEVTSKEFHELKEIYLLEFIDSDEKLFILGKGSDEEGKLNLVIWDLYNTGNVQRIVVDNVLTVKDIGHRLARTSGNLLVVDDNGVAVSVLKKIEDIINQTRPDEINDNLKEYFDTKLGENSNGELDESHIIHFDENINPNFKPIVVEIEPWVIDNFERHSYCLYDDEKETLQLIVGRTTVQIWHQIHNYEPFLEYIWINDVPVNQENEETRLQIKEFKYGLSDGSGDKDKLNGFCLKVYWYKNNPKVPEEKTISWKDISEKARAIRHACKALERLNMRRKLLANHYVKVHQFEKLITHIKHIVCKFVKYKPDRFIMLDVRYNVMKNLILGDCDYLIKFILFNDEDGKVNENERQVRHVPRCKLWPGKVFINDRDYKLLQDDERIKPENDMELAIYHCRDRELKDTIIIAYLLEYYCVNATDNAGWMCTVSKSLPLLFKYNYDDYARKLFRKECFADQDYFSAQDPLEIIPKEFLARRNHDIKFRAFRPIVKLQSDKYKYKWYNQIWHSIKVSKFKMLKFSEDFDNSLGKSPLALRMVPLPKFTIQKFKRKKVKYDLTKRIINALWFFLIPRWHKIGRNDKDTLSPFSNVIRYEQNDDLYDNPATEAVIDFHWRKARNFYFFLFLRFLLFSLCFVYISWEYINQNVAMEGNFLFALIILFYYFASYLFAVEMIQLHYHGPRKYFGEIFNSFDMSNCINIFSIVFPVVITSIMLKKFQFSDGFGSVGTVDTDIIMGISFSIFFLWIGVILYLRLIAFFAVYIYYILIIFRTVFPFIMFMMIIIIAFSHTMFILLKAKLATKDSSMSGTATNDNSTYYDVHLQNDFDVNDRNDNPYSTFATAIEATYFWLNGNYAQVNSFDYWAVDIFTFAASIILVIVLQNMLIAFMGGVYERTESKGRQALLRFRANHIAEYEALNHMHFWRPEPEPKYIYYIGQSKNFEDWYKLRKHDQGEIFKDFEDKYTFKSHISNASTFKEDVYNDKFSIWEYDDEENEEGKKGSTEVSLQDE